MGSKRRTKQGGGPTPKKQKKASSVPLPEAPADSDLEVSDEDVHFVDEYSQRLGFLTALNRAQIDRDVQRGNDKGKANREAAKAAAAAALAARKQAEAEEAGEEYERAPRHRMGGKGSAAEDVRRAEPLPVKLAGRLVYRTLGQSAESDVAVAQVPPVTGVTIEEQPLQEELDPTQPSSSGSPVVSDDDGGAEEGGSVMITDDEEGGDEGGSSEDDGERLDEGPPPLPGPPAADDELQAWQRRAEQREELKQAIALGATRLLQEPEAHGRAELPRLVVLAGDADAMVARLAMLSLAAVFRDVLPGYRIRLPTEKELAMPVSKEQKRLREHESALLRAYQGYLKALLKGCNAAEGGGMNPQADKGVARLGTARVAVRCLALLLASLPHFNYAGDILQAIVPRMAHRDRQIAAECCAAIGKLLRADAAGDGSIVRDAVQLVADLVKRRKCAVRPDVVRVLLGLRLSDAVASDVKSGEQREYKSRKSRRKEKKARKAAHQDEVSTAFKEAQVSTDRAQRRAVQSETLEALFEILFRVLKQATASGLLASGRSGPPLSEARCAKKFPLLSPALAGLARFSHLISVEYFGDLLAVMLRMLSGPGLPVRIRLAVLLTASDILKGQGEALNVDRHELYQALYYALGASPLGALQAQGSPTAEGVPTCTASSPQHAAAAAGGAEKGGAGRAKQKGGSSHQDRHAEEEAGEQLPLEVLLARAVHQMLVDQAKALDASRLGAFALRLAGCAHFLDTPGALGLLAVLQHLLRQHARLRGMLDAEPGGPVPPPLRNPNPHDLEAAAACALGSQLWQLGQLQQLHPSSDVRAAAQRLMAMPADSASAYHIPALASPDGPAGVAAAALRSRSAAPSGPAAAAVPAASDEAIASLQAQLDTYYVKARGAGESEKERDGCRALALHIMQRRRNLLGQPAMSSSPAEGRAPTQQQQRKKQGRRQGGGKGGGQGNGKKARQGGGVLKDGAKVKQR